jgi:alpha-D-xyloside xylohydrolase
MELRIYPGKDASFSLYEDNNDGHEYLNNKFTNIKFEYSEKDKTLTIGNIEGTYAGMITERLFKVVIVSDKNGYGLKPSEICQDVLYKGKKIKVKLL